MTREQAVEALVHVYETFHGPLTLALWEFNLIHKHNPSPAELKDFLLSGRMQFRNEFESWTEDWKRIHEQG